MTSLVKRSGCLKQTGFPNDFKIFEYTNFYPHFCFHMSRDMRKSAFAYPKTCNSAADQCLCFQYIDSTIPLLPKSKISSLWPSSVAVQPALCRTCSEIQKRRQVFSRCGSLNYRIYISLQFLALYRIKQPTVRIMIICPCNVDPLTPYF